MIFSPFSLRSMPFSWLRFGAFMAGLAVIAGISLLLAEAPDRARDAAQTAAGQAAATQAQFGVVRFGAPAEEIRGQLRQLGLPWFLRKQGASGQFDWDGDSNATLRVIWRGQSVGRFVQRLVAMMGGQISLQAWSTKAASSHSQSASIWHQGGLPPIGRS